MMRHAKLLAVVTTALLVGCWLGAAALSTSSAAGMSTRPERAGNAAPPMILRGSLIKPQPGTAKLGTLVKPSELGERVFVDGKVGFALGGVGQAQYPAETTDGGAVWKTFGPQLHVDAAQAPLSVGEIGVADAQTIFFYGGGQAVDATGDGGKHWWQTLTGGLSAAVVPFGGHLLWFTQETPGSQAVTWAYSSTDGGQIWHYTTAVGG